MRDIASTAVLITGEFLRVDLIGTACGRCRSNRRKRTGVCHANDGQGANAWHGQYCLHQRFWSTGRCPAHHSARAGFARSCDPRTISRILSLFCNSQLPVSRHGDQQSQCTLLREMQGIDGIKTGYTEASGYNLVASATCEVLGFCCAHSKSKTPSAGRKSLL
jgi:hypothetical protein